MSGNWSLGVDADDTTYIAHARSYHALRSAAADLIPSNSKCKPLRQSYRDHPPRHGQVVCRDPRRRLLGTWRRGRKSDAGRLRSGLQDSVAGHLRGNGRWSISHVTDTGHGHWTWTVRVLATSWPMSPRHYHATSWVTANITGDSGVVMRWGFAFSSHYYRTQSMAVRGQSSSVMPSSWGPGHSS